MTDAKKYSKLMGAVDYDHEAAEELAEALNEIEELNARVTQLKQLVNENQELHDFVWRTAGNETLAIHNLEDDHLSNVMLHLLRTGRPIPRGIRGEASKRGLTIPATVPVGWEDAPERRLSPSRMDYDDGF